MKSAIGCSIQNAIRWIIVLLVGWMISDMTGADDTGMQIIICIATAAGLTLIISVFSYIYNKISDRKIEKQQEQERRIRHIEEMYNFLDMNKWCIIDTMNNVDVIKQRMEGLKIQLEEMNKRIDKN